MNRIYPSMVAPEGHRPRQDASQAQGEVERLSVAMLTARATFERIRVMLINELDEPVRRAFWAAVAGRDALDNAMPILSPAPGATAQDGAGTLANPSTFGKPTFGLSEAPTSTIPAGMAAERRDDHRGWQIEYSPPPIPVRDFDYVATHPDYDGAPDANESRRVFSSTIRGIVTEINNWYEDNAE